MDAAINYADAAQAAAARSGALRWLLDAEVIGEAAIAHQFHLNGEAIEAVRDGTPLLVGSDKAVRIDRMVATQSLLLDGYSPGRMAEWFRAPLPSLGGRCASDVLAKDDDATSDVLEAAESWMG